jgi:type VI protein secretion system component VasK
VFSTPGKLLASRLRNMEAVADNARHARAFLAQPAMTRPLPINLNCVTQAEQVLEGNGVRAVVAGRIRSLRNESTEGRP